MYWNGWTLDRIVIAFVSLAYLLIGIQIWMFHYRQNFNRKVMYVPVVLSPLIFAIGIWLAFNRMDWLATLYGFALIAGIVVGLTGFYFHFKGVGVRVGGYALRNFLIGPPVILPLVFSALGVLGFIALYWS